MAKTTQEYFDILKEEWSTFPELAALASEVSNAQEFFVKLTTDSPVAMHDLMLWVQATGCAETDAEVEHTFNMILQEMPKRKYGSPAWYVEMAKLFQYGDTVAWDQGKFFYTVIDLAKRIIKQAAVVPIAQGVRLKVAKLSGTSLAPIDSTEMDALADYFNNNTIGIKPAGVHLVITSNIPDLLMLGVRIVRNPQVLAANGSSIISPSQFPVEEAINNYIQYLPFNGEFNRTKLEDVIQSVPGVIDVEIDTAMSKYGTFDWQEIDLKYRADAGYMMIDPENPLSTTIQYQLDTL